MKQSEQKLYSIRQTGTDIVISFKGDWIVENLNKAKDIIEQLSFKEKKITVDLAHINKIDITGAFLIKKIIAKLNNKMSEVKVIGLRHDYEMLFNIIDIDIQSHQSKKDKFQFLYNIGENIVNSITEVINFLSFFGEIFHTILKSILKPKKIRIKEILYEIEYTGVYAIPIVALVGMLVGVVIAYQGAAQLSRFGASIFIIDLISLSITREMAPLLTAIMVAGRSGSAYTASIGSMVLNQEVDSLKIIGIHPLELLVIPKVIAMVISLPLLIFISDVIGIVSGIYLANLVLNIDITTLIIRLKTTMPLSSFFIGIIKGPIFAVPIVLISCFRGFSVKKDSEELGINTTKSVVSTIFIVIIIDAILSIVFQKLGI